MAITEVYNTGYTKTELADIFLKADTQIPILQEQVAEILDIIRDLPVVITGEIILSLQGGDIGEMVIGEMTVESEGE